MDAKNDAEGRHNKGEEQKDYAKGYIYAHKTDCYYRYGGKVARGKGLSLCILIDCRQGFVSLVGPFAVGNVSDKGADIKSRDAGYCRKQGVTGVGIYSIYKEKKISRNGQNFENSFRRNECFTQFFMPQQIFH